VKVYTRPCPYCKTDIRLGNVDSPSWQYLRNHERRCKKASDNERDYFLRNGVWPSTSGRHSWNRPPWKKKGKELDDTLYRLEKWLQKKTNDQLIDYLLDAAKNKELKGTSKLFKDFEPHDC
jgi:glutaredoxin